MDAPALTDAKRRVIEQLKRGGAAPAAELADRLGLTDVAVRQHLGALREMGLVIEAASRAGSGRGRGRPAAVWSLTALAGSLFPDRHGELTVELIDATRRALGEEGLRRIVEVRARDQRNLYGTLVPRSGSLKQRVEALAEQRSAEGYMAEVVQERPGVYLLIEHHCPICQAARSCTGLCSAELDVFRRVLGRDVRVERTSHLLAGGDRCVYRIRRGR